MGRLTGNSETQRLSLAGMLGFGPITILLAVGLGMAEPAIVASGFDRYVDLFGCQSADGVPGLGYRSAKRGGTRHHGDGAGTR